VLGRGRRECVAPGGPQRPSFPSGDGFPATALRGGAVLTPFGPGRSVGAPPPGGSSLPADAVAIFRAGADSPDSAFLFLGTSPEGPFGPRRLEGRALGPWGPPGGAGRPPPASPPGEQAHQGPGGADVGLPPLYLGVLPLPSGDPFDPEAEGYRYLCAYAGHAIR